MNMKLKTVRLLDHFYLYCALFYANNASMDYSAEITELKQKIVTVLENTNVPKLEMPLHAYHYLVGLYNPKGYEARGTKQNHLQEVLDYVVMLANISGLKDIFKEYENALDEKLKAYETKFSYIQEYFKAHFDFEPALNKFSITRNWDSSGKCIKTKSGYIIFVGWIPTGLNSNQIMHEMLHAYIHECVLQIPANIQTYIEGAERAFRSYHNEETIVEESIVRALVVYLDRLDGEKFGFSLSKNDLDMKLPEMYLGILEKDRITRFTKDYFSNLKV